MASRRTNGGQPALKIACFGKHPGWDDHIEDIGLTTDLLVRAKRVIYTEGIGGNVDAGAWEKLDEANRLPAFKHLFVWRTGDGLVIGRMWSSRDGKGRSKYPMIVAAQASGVHEGWAMSVVLPALADLERKCVEATTASGVKAAIAGTEASLKELVAGAYSGNNSPTTAAGSEDRELLKRLAGSAELAVPGTEGSVPEGLLRVLYEVDRELAAYRPGTRGTRMGGLAPHQLRVPKGVPGVGEAPRAWAALLDQELMPETPMLFIEPMDQPFVDIIVGDPAPASFFCVRCARQALPLTTEVPYTIEGPFRADAGAKIEAWARGQSPDRGTKSVKVKADASPASISSNAGKPSSAGGAGGKSKMPLFVGLGVGAVVLIAAAYMLSGGGSTPAGSAGSSGTNTATNEPKPETKTPPTVENKPEVKPEPKPTTTTDVPDPKTSSKPPATPATTPTTAPPATTPPATAASTPPATTPPATAASTPPKAPDPVVAAGADPRPAWDVTSRISKAREDLQALNAELKIEGKPELSAIAQDLDNATKRAKIARELPWSSANALAITKDVASVDQLVETARSSLTSARGELQTRIAAWVASQTAPSDRAAITQAWKAAITNVDSKAGWAAAKAKVAELSATMTKVDAAIKALPVWNVPPIEGVDTTAIARLDDDRRAKAAQSAVESALKSPAGVDRGIAEAISPYSTWAQQLRDVVGKAATLDAMLRAGHLPEESVAGTSIRDLTQTIGQSPAIADVGSLLKPVLDRAAGAGTVSDPITTLKAGPADLSTWAQAVALATKSDWPKTEADFDGAAGVFAKAAATLAASTATPERKKELSSALVALATSAWTNYVNARGNTDAGLDRIAAGPAAWNIAGFTPPAPPPALIFNQQRRALAQAMSEPGKGSDAMRKQRDAVASFTKVVSALPDDVKNSAAAKAIFASFEKPTGAAAAADLSTLGPGAAGWTLVPGEDRSLAVYTKNLPGGTRSLAFRRVQAEGQSDASFVCTSEVSLGLFADAVSAGNAWGEFRTMLPAMDQEDGRRGARTWEKSGEGIAPAKPAPPDTSQGWLRIRPNMSGKPYYPAGVKVEPPTRDMPMQYVSPQAAVAMAKLIGCRIPTSGEWKAANAESPTTNANLRDATYAAEMDHLVPLSNLNPEYPASGIFVPKDGQRTPSVKDTTPAVQGDDSVLWFVATGEGASTFANLIGNVAEYVVEAPGPMDALADATKAAAEAALAKGESLRVIGGSALSPKQVPNDVPQLVAFGQAAGGYSDVGFRLAFTAPKGAGVGVDVAKVKAAIESAGYLSVTAPR